MFAQREREALGRIPEHALERAAGTDPGCSRLRYFEVFAHLKGTDLMVHLPRCCTVSGDARTAGFSLYPAPAYHTRKQTGWDRREE